MLNPILFWRNKMRATSQHRLQQLSRDIYQICEYEGQLWITVDGMRAIPTSMLSLDPLEALAQLRDLYIHQHQ